MSQQCIRAGNAVAAYGPWPHGVLQNAWCLRLPQRAARVKGGRAAMATQPTHPRSRSSVRPPRRVVLEVVVRRDAAQRLSLALTLLARAANEDGADASAAVSQPTDGVTATDDPTPTQEEQPL
jgi:hypothetical protein